jgi:hypothetical protein
MKIRSLLITFLAIASFAFVNAQTQTIHNLDAKPTITKEKIIQNGQSSNQSKEQITLDFEGLGSSDEILDFYNGGTSGQGFSGIDFGIYFGGNALSSIDEDEGGSGNFANEPSPSTVMFFLTGSAVMNVPNGFVEGFSFFYSTADESTVYVYDGLDATGNIIASATLPPLTLGEIGGDPTGYYDNWQPFGISFEGVAKSVDFTGVQNHCGFDNVTFGNANPPLNIPPVAQGMPAVQPVELMVGDTYNLTLSFLSPEETQITDAVVNPFGLFDFTYTVTPGNVCTVEMDLLGTVDNLGLHQIEIIATDDGTPPESTTVNLEFLITSLDPVINVNPTSLSESLYPDEVSTQFLTISNTGDAELTFDLEDIETSKRLKIKGVKKSFNDGDHSRALIDYFNFQSENGSKATTDVSWLSETPMLGS